MGGVGAKRGLRGEEEGGQEGVKGRGWMWDENVHFLPRVACPKYQF